MTVQCALLKCYTILGYNTETVLLIFPFLQSNITVQMRPVEVSGVRHCENTLLYFSFPIYFKLTDFLNFQIGVLWDPEIPSNYAHEFKIVTSTSIARSRNLKTYCKQTGSRASTELRGWIFAAVAFRLRRSITIL